LHFVRLPDQKEEEFQTHYFETYHKEDMTGAEEALAYGKRLTDRISSHLYGETTEQAQRGREEAQRAREEERRAREEERQARLALQRKMEEAVLNLHRATGWSAEKIAEVLQLGHADVSAILKAEK
jgi:ribosome-binding protein aMBF1 (putative translation factor)